MVINVTLSVSHRRRVRAETVMGSGETGRECIIYIILLIFKGNWCALSVFIMEGNNVYNQELNMWLIFVVSVCPVLFQEQRLHCYNTFETKTKTRSQVS